MCFGLRQSGIMVTYGGMSKKPITVSTSSFIFKVSLEDSRFLFFLFAEVLALKKIHIWLFWVCEGIFLRIVGLSKFCCANNHSRPCGTVVFDIHFCERIEGFILKRVIRSRLPL